MTDEGSHIDVDPLFGGQALLLHVEVTLSIASRQRSPVDDHAQARIARLNSCRSARSSQPFTVWTDVRRTNSRASGVISRCAANTAAAESHCG